MRGQDSNFRKLLEKFRLKTQVCTFHQKFTEGWFWEHFGWVHNSASNSLNSRNLSWSQTCLFSNKNSKKVCFQNLVKSNYHILEQAFKTWISSDSPCHSIYMNLKHQWVLQNLPREFKNCLQQPKGHLRDLCQALDLCCANYLTCALLN